MVGMFYSGAVPQSLVQVYSRKHWTDTAKCITRTVALWQKMSYRSINSSLRQCLFTLSSRTHRRRSTSRTHRRRTPFPGTPTKDAIPGHTDEGRHPGNTDEWRRPGHTDEERHPGHTDEGRHPGHTDEGRRPGQILHDIILLTSTVHSFITYYVVQHTIYSSVSVQCSQAIP